MTKSRQAVLAILQSAAGPLSAAEVFAQMSDSVDQATVYRTLHYLEDSGKADSFILHCEEDGTKRYYEPAEANGMKTHRHWFHCEKCHQFTDLGECRMDRLVRTYEKETGIEVKTHMLCLTGLCARCRNYGV
jgi:Fur family ferric uptake transcriptional regulator